MGTYSRTGSHRVNGANAFFAEHGYVEVPSLVQWMATLQCELSCAHCLAVSHEAGFPDMPLERVRKLIDEVAALGVAEFLVTGGEPLARPDLAEVIAYLGHKQINWTLNTAALPDKALREAIARSKPGFVAVSLDGPRQVHDAFRGKTGAYDEATEAIRFFKSLAGVRVCAGTTVTTRNYDYLDETFHLAAANGADQWGIHLLVPEGRAATQPGLFLSKSQLKRLIKFVARKRRYFHVEMADEIGYLGYLEPLVRDRPLICGAGRSQCVVLPDGEVVPCTTLDRSCSAGNIHERSLMQIWNEGFADLRAWQPTGKCGHCDYAVACKGGCWLQRKAGQQCFKDVWHIPGVLKTAAGIAICLGGLATGPATSAASAALPMDNDTLSHPPARRTVTGNGIQIAQYQELDAAIMDFYVELAVGLETDGYTPWSDAVDDSDPGSRFFLDFKEGTLPEDITERCAMVRSALETEQPSLSLIALLWRAVNGPLFETDNVTEYNEVERQEIRDTLAALQEKADAWRLEIFAGSLDLYLQRGRRTPDGPRSKAGPRPGDKEKRVLQKDLDEERWGATSDPASSLTEERSLLEREAAEAYLLEHHCADQMDLVFTFSGTSELIKYTNGEEALISSHIDGNSTGAHTIGVFDVITAIEDVSLSFGITGTLKVVPSKNSDEQALLNDGQAGDEDLSEVITVTLRAGNEYTYVELLQAIYYDRKRSTLLSMAYDWIPRDDSSVWNQSAKVIVAVNQNGALLWPAFREMIEAGAVFLPGERRSSIEIQLSDEDLGRAVLKEIDFWMF